MSEKQVIPDEELEARFKQDLKAWLDKHPGANPDILDFRYFYWAGAVLGIESCQKIDAEAL